MSAKIARNNVNVSEETVSIRFIPRNYNLSATLTLWLKFCLVSSNHQQNSISISIRLKNFGNLSKNYQKLHKRIFFLQFVMLFESFSICFEPSSKISLMLQKLNRFFWIFALTIRSKKNFELFNSFLAPNSKFSQNLQKKQLIFSDYFKQNSKKNR